MDAVSYSLASKQAQRIEKFINEPDSTSGIVTVPKVIASGETITIPAGRVAILPNVQIDGVLNVEGEVFIPSGATLGDLDAQLALKADTSYVNAQLVLKQNVLVANDAGVKTALNASGTAPIYACRAWGVFSASGVLTISGSGNVASITDNGVGNYAVNFIEDMPDANYAVTLSWSPLVVGNPTLVTYHSRTASCFSLSSTASNGGAANTQWTLYDNYSISFSVKR